jgi:hypothetical protein
MSLNHVLLVLWKTESSKPLKGYKNSLEPSHRHLLETPFHTSFRRLKFIKWNAPTLKLSLKKGVFSFHWSSLKAGTNWLGVKKGKDWASSPRWRCFRKDGDHMEIRGSFFES